jgi:2-dehydro-3-deoxy-L-rhamnonate dehydrogenase (NAD+)
MYTPRTRRWCLNRIALEGRAAIVTGGAQGIGFAITKRLLASGASVAIWDADEPVLTKAVDTLKPLGNVHGEVVDVTNAPGVGSAHRNSLARFGTIDILVANAGIAGPNHKTWEYPIDAWRRVLEINLTGVFLCCRTVLPHMLERNYGRVVNVASIAGKEGNPNASAYSASKAGVVALTKSLGKETAGKNIAVNCITPAAAKTRIFEQMTQEHIDFMLSKIPRGRFVEVNEVAAMVAWLVSEENSFTTGAVFDLSGGRATY